VFDCTNKIIFVFYSVGILCIIILHFVDRVSCKSLIHKLNRQIQRKTDHTQTKRNDKKLWSTFTYHSPKIRKITNLLKNTNIGIAFRTTTTLPQLTKPTPTDRTL